MQNESFDNFVLLVGSYSPRVFAAIIAGAIVGIEGEISNRPAGLRTNILITLGSALLSILSHVAGQTFGGDATRIAAQIITGIGFIGAGVILHNREQIHGITTAAMIFVTAAIGMTIGFGFLWSGIGIALIVFLVLLGLRPVGRAIENAKWLRSWRRLPHAEAKTPVVRRRTSRQKTRKS
ncbi:MAG: MgtC/SapB family protein [Turneriella sp.]|nr:MgtC/SapB family protein [Turneriella sp.]